MTRKEPIQEPEKYNKYEYIVDENFLDEVLGHMYTTRGTYHEIEEVRRDLENKTGKKKRYNDVLMALEKLAKDEYVKYEGEREPAHHVYRLTYDGYIAVKSSESSTPYQDLIQRQRIGNNRNKWKTRAIVANAITLIIITGLASYSQFSSDRDAKTITRLEEQVTELTKAIEESKEANMKLRLELNTARMTTTKPSENNEQKNAPPGTPKNSTSPVH
jgi:hypothetical protein